MSGLPQIPIERLRPHHSNIRTDLGDLSELAASIRAVGLLQPLVVVPAGGDYEVLDGNRRLAAARLAGAKALPCLATRLGDADHQTSVMLAAAMHQALAPLDQAQAFLALRNSGLSVPDIARRTGYSTATVSARLMLIDLPDEVQDMVRDKEINVTEATNLARQVRRTKAGTAVTTAPKGAWFTSQHRLAKAVMSRCAHLETRRLIGGAGCGQCWEEEIRFDERERQTTPAIRAVTG